MEYHKKSVLTESELRALLMLWNNEYPRDLNFQSVSALEAYLDRLIALEHLIIYNAKKEIIGWYYHFIREQEKWFALIIDSKSHRKGMGTKILSYVKKKENQLNGWVIDHNNSKKNNGEVYYSPLNFYLKNDFQVLPSIRLENKEMSAVKIKWVQQD